MVDPFFFPTIIAGFACLLIYAITLVCKHRRGDEIIVGCLTAMLSGFGVVSGVKVIAIGCDWTSVVLNNADSGDRTAIFFGGVSLAMISVYGVIAPLVKVLQNKDTSSE